MADESWLDAFKAAGGREPASYNTMPAELKIAIWKPIIRDYPPSFVEIGLKPEYAGENAAWRSGMYDIRCERVPEAVSSGVEARDEAEKRYQLTFSSITGRPVYFDMNGDFLHLRDTWNDWYTTYPGIHSDLAQVKNLAIYATPGQGGMALTLGWIASMDYLRPFLGLRRLRVQRININDNTDSAMDRSEVLSLGRYWLNIINPLQLEAGVEVTEPPVVEYISATDPVDYEQRLAAFAASGRRQFF